LEQSKRIWELHPSAVRKVVALALPRRDLQEIARIFGIAGDDPCVEDCALYTRVVKMCFQKNAVSLHTEKLIEKRFLVHERRIPLHDPAQLVGRLRESPRDGQAPLWAVLWGMATRGLLEDPTLRASLFGHMHEMEYRLLRNDSESLYCRGSGDGRQMEKDTEILRLKDDLLDMKWINKRLEELIRKFRNLIDVSCPAQRASETVSDIGIALPEGCDCPTGKTVNKLKHLLDQAYNCNYEHETENAQLKEKIEDLVAQLGLYQTRFIATQPSESHGACPYAHRLRGKTITLVGGVESLECYYRQLIESSGGQFCRHEGTSEGGEKELHECILGSDLVVCPVKANSLNEAEWVKKVCTARGVRCCFPTSASITGLRKALQDYYSDQQVA